MKVAALNAVLASALTLFSLPACEGSSAHRLLHQQLHKKSLGHVHHGHHHTVRETTSPAAVNVAFEKRGGDCQFPNDPDLVAVTPGSANAGWAMSPDQPCKRNSYCPIACKPGMVMAQWDPKSKYTYPASMNGGLFCDSNGQIHKPFPDKPYCVPGTGTVKALNQCNGHVSFCQTVLPGNEAMLIPTLVNSPMTLAVPDITYWDSTASHFYINPPGTGSEGCIWGDSSKPIGNWAAYVAGANTDSNGQTFVKIGWNPVYQASGLGSTKPSYGVKIECPGGDCNGLPCAIAPHGSGSVDSKLAAAGAGGADFCVVTVPKGSTANIVVYDGSGGNGGGDDASSSSESSKAPPPPSTSQAPTTTQQPTTTSSSTSTTPTSTSTSTTPSSTSSSSTSSEHHYPTVLPGIFHENSTTSSDSDSSTYITSSPSATHAPSKAPAPKTKTKDNEAGRQQGNAALVSLIVAFIATACFF